MKTLATLAALFTCLCAVPAQAASFFRVPIVLNPQIVNGGLQPADADTSAPAQFEILTTPQADYSAGLGASYVIWQTVTNIGASPAVVDLAMVRNVTGGFALLIDQCSGVTLAPGTACNLGVKFKPPRVGSYSAEVEVIDPQNNSTQATLLANGVDGVGGLTFSVAGPQPVPVQYTGGPTDVLVTVTASKGPAAIQHLFDDSTLFEGVTLTDNQCDGKVLQAGQTCTVSVQLNGLDFSPDLDGYKVILEATSQISSAWTTGGFSFSVIAP
jgi:hypothetical protein